MQTRGVGSCTVRGSMLLCVKLCIHVRSTLKALLEGMHMHNCLHKSMHLIFE